MDKYYLNIHKVKFLILRKFIQMETHPVLCAKDISKNFENHRALYRLSLEIPRQSIFGLLGPNGAGKTTFIRIVNQILAPDEGYIEINGEKLREEHIYRIGYLPEERGLYKKMKVGEQAVYLARLKGLSRDEAVKRLKHWFEKFDIMPWWNKKVEELSKGMAQKVQFITTVLHEPELLILDEPFSGFDPINTELIKKEILQLRDKGATIIFSTHNMESVEEICDRIALINQGQKILEGPVREIKKQYADRTYILKLSGETFDTDLLLEDQFKVLDLTREGDQNIVRVKLAGEAGINDLLTLLLPHYTINGLEESIPGMREIFIRTVGNQAQNHIQNK